MRPHQFDHSLNEFIVWNQAIPKSISVDGDEKQNTLIVLFPENGAVVTDQTIQVRGITSPGTHRIGVQHVTSESNDVYFLRKFNPGDTQWLYTLSKDYGNFYQGANEYKIMAFDEKGEEIASFFLTVKKE